MDPGVILYFTSHKMAGYAARPKYHVYVSGPGLIIQGHSFLLINSDRYGPDCFEILKKDYGFLDRDSFIGLNTLMDYTVDEIKGGSPELKGKLSTDHLVALRAKIEDSATLTGHERKYVREAWRNF